MMEGEVVGKRNQAMIGNGVGDLLTTYGILVGREEVM